MRVAVLVTDPELVEAVSAALSVPGSMLSFPDAPAALEAGDWDVCVAEAGFTGAVLEARRGRGLVIITGTSGPPAAVSPGRGGGAVVLLRAPCTLEDLREAVRSTAAATQAGAGPAFAP